MRDDFEFYVYVNDTLHNGNESNDSTIKYICTFDSRYGVIKKTGNKITLTLSQVLMKKDSSSLGITTSNDKVQNEKDNSTLFATTWGGSMHFIINKYNKISGSHDHRYNSISYGEVAIYEITDMSITSQFNLSEKVYQCSYYIDYIGEWFSCDFSSLLNENMSWSYLNFISKKNENVDFKLSIDNNKDNLESTIVVVDFMNPQSKNLVYYLGVQLRNFFQLLSGKDLGIYRIILNNDLSWDGKLLSPRDERENWFIAQSYLPNKTSKSFNNFTILYTDIQEKFEEILQNYLSNIRLQSFLDRFLVTRQYKMPITPIFLILSSAIESYYSNLKYTNGKVVKEFSKKLNMLFNCSLEDKDENKELINKIKNNRNYYIHGDKMECKLSETELVPIIIKFMKATEQRLLSEILK